MKIKTILTSLFTLLLLSQSAIAINSDVAKNPLLSFEPELYMKSINGSDLHVLKGSDEPYTGLASITNSIWKDVVIKESFVDGRQSLGTRMFYNKSTGEKLSGEFALVPTFDKSVELFSECDYRFQIANIKKV